MLDLFSAPTSFRLNAINLNNAAFAASPMLMYAHASTNDTIAPLASAALHVMKDGSTGGGHPSLGNLMLLVFEAVMEVVCVSLPGYIIARMGMFDTENQKFVANLNVNLFTPCLIFTKLASQLTLAKIAELAVIPVIFVFMTMVSYLCALAVTKVFRFEKRARNFVIAMGVFGNSNSLPISLVLSLAMTISGLHWDRIPGDNDEEVGARGILYLLIFQQLGQLLRWSWGYHVLLAPPESYENHDSDNENTVRYRDEASDDEEEDLTGIRVDPFKTPQFENSISGLNKPAVESDPLLPTDQKRNHNRKLTGATYDSAFESAHPSGQRTPISNQPSAYPSSTSLSSQNTETTCPSSAGEPPLQGNGGNRDITSFPSIGNSASAEQLLPRWSTPAPTSPFGRILNAIVNGVVRFGKGLWAFMNPPLWAMLAAMIVASIPQLQTLFFTKGTFIQTSVTRAVTQSGQVAVPLILVILGANLANSTSNKSKSPHADKQETKILIASLISRMLLPFVFIAPVLAIAAKYLNISILDDPIFVVVCFLLTGAPSALQLAQICQINNVYEDVITRVLFWSYVVVILPSTLVLVITAIEVVHWAM
ncbi:auxin efflux carrier [Geopyxis carbonaria]|nr:auxin efflux carrier [Geopyxis carbonaria]